MNKKIIELSKKKLKKLYAHAVNSTALLVPGTPIFALFETMSNANYTEAQSTYSRLWGAAVTYFGLGKLYEFGQEKSREFFNIVTDEKKKDHDALYGAAYNAIITPIWAYAVGLREVGPIMWNTACMSALGLVIGGLAGYSMEAYQDFVGLKDSTRLPARIKKQSRTVKLGLASLGVAASIAATEGIYKVGNYIKGVEPSAPKAGLEKIVELNTAPQLK
ncbi:hypothetical protein KA107_00375 [Candidatus Pacearchaeota archaeon]|nr:hypothetical protein [Candidatus Pacearchaeota archaeon]